MARFTSNLIRFAALSLLIQSSGCASRPAALAHSDTVRATAVVEAHERELLRALVRRDRAASSQYLASDFTCSVTGEHPFTLNRTAARFPACAGMGQDLSSRASLPEPVRTLEDRGPRLGEIVSMQSTESDGSIVVVSTQLYQRWVPYDGNAERRSRLTDTWMRRGGEWQLVRRISEPLPSAANGRS